MGAPNPNPLSPRKVRWMLNLYPPFLFQRVRLATVSPDFRSALVEVRRSLFNRNLHGTTFGGSIYSAADPIAAVLYWQIFAHAGERVESWLAGARVAFRKPAASHLRMRFEISEDDLSAVRAALAREGRARRVHRVEAVDREGEVCAEIETEVYLRQPRAEGGVAF